MTTWHRPIPSCSEVTSEELAVDREVGQGLKAGVKKDEAAVLKTYWGNYIFHIDDLPFPPDQTPPIYTQFRKLVETRCPVREVLPIPKKLQPLPTLPEGTAVSEEGPVASLEELWGMSGGPPVTDPLATEAAVCAYRGGETAALARVRDYIWTLDLLKDYKDTRE